jgi:hypothetical protein
VNIEGSRTNIRDLSGIRTRNPVDECSRPTPQTVWPPDRQDAYVVFVTELNTCLWYLYYSFMLTVVDITVFQVCIVDATEFTSVFFWIEL